MPEGSIVTNRLASCGFGQLTAKVGGYPVRNSICHCRACQRRTGGPFAQQARFHRSDIAVAGTSTACARTGDDESTCTFHFCPMCGATVYYEPDTMADFISIPMGAFADPQFRTPTVSVYESRMHR